MPDERQLDWEKVLAKLISEARQDVHEAENAVRRAKSRLTLLTAIDNHRAGHANRTQEES